jgi:YVTN family beta-propeller protein
VTDGDVTINGVAATHRGGGVWRINATKSTAQSVTYDTLTAIDNTRGITSVDMNNQNAAVEWIYPDAVVMNLWPSKDYVNVGDTVNIYADLIYEDTETTVNNGDLTLNGLTGGFTEDTDPSSRTITVGTWPRGVAFDTENGNVYITNCANNTVSVIRVGTDSTLATIPVGNYPWDVEVDTTHDKAYVINRGDNTTSVIDTSTYAVIATIPVGSEPMDVALNPANGLIYVVAEVSEVVNIIDPDTDTVTATIPVGWFPEGITFDTVNNRFYVSNFLGRTVDVIDGATNTVIDTLTAGDGCIGIGIDKLQQKLYVANSHNGTVTIIDLSTNTIIDDVAIGGAPCNIVVDEDNGKVYVTNYLDGVYVIDTTTDAVIYTLSVGAGPFGIARNPDTGAICVTSYDSDYITFLYTSWLFTDSYDVVTTVTYDTLTLSDNARGVDTVDMNGKSATVTWEQVKVVSVTTSDEIVCVGTSVDVNFTLVYASDDTPVTDGNVYIEGINAVNQGNGVWKASITKNTNQTITFDSVAVNNNARGITSVDANNQSANVTWRAPYTIVSTLYSSRSTINTNSTVCLYFTLAYEDTDVPIIDGTVTLNGLTATYGYKTDTITVGSHPTDVAVDSANGKAYVVNNAGNTVSVVNLTDGTLLSTITVGISPFCAEIDTASGKVYVTNFGENTVSVIDTATDTVIANVIVGANPYGLAIDTTNSEVYVAISGEDTVAVISIVTDTVANTFSVGDYPSMIAIDTNVGFVYITNYLDDTVSTTFTGMYFVLDTIAAGDGPIGITADPTNSLAYTAHFLDGSISTIDLLWSTNNVMLSSLGGVYDLAYDDEIGVLYATDNTGDSLLVVDVSTGTILSTVPVGDQPYCVTLDKNTGVVYVANMGDDTITVLTPTWSTTDTKATPQTITYDTITISDNSRNTTVAHMNGANVSVTWDRVKLQQIAASQTNVEPNTQVNIDATLVYASDNAPVIDGNVTIEGTNATHRGAGVWRISKTYNTDTTVTFDTVTVSGNTRNITIIDLNNKSVFVRWETPPEPVPPVNNTTPITPANNTYTVNQMTASTRYLDVGGEAIVKVHVSDNDGDAEGCTVHLGELSSETNGEGWATFTVTSDTPIEQIFDVTSLTGIDGNYTITAEPVTITWDTVEITITILHDCYNIGEAPEVTYTAVYASDGAAFTGDITFDTPSGIGLNTACVKTLTDSERGITTYTCNEVTYVNDCIEVTASGSSKVSASLSEPITIWFKAQRAHSGEAFSASSGSLNANGLNLQWSDANNRWEASTTYGVSTVKTFRVASASDTEHGITALIRGGGVTVEWTDGSTIPTVETLNGTETTNTTTTKTTPRLTLTLSADEKTMSVTASGSLSANEGALGGWSLLMEYRTTGSFIWNTLTTVTTGAEGGYSYTWNIAEEGAYEVRVTSSESEAYAEASKHASISVEPTEVDYILVTSNSTLSLVDVAGSEFSFTVTGESGTWGHAEIKVYKSTAASIGLVKVFIDNVEVSYNYIEYDGYWLIVVDYTHSQHTVDVVVEKPGVDYTPYYALGTLLALFLLLLILWRRKKEEKLGVVKS